MNVKIKVRINKKNNNNIEAYVGLTFDECFAVNGLKVIDGKNGLFVAFPSYKTSDGTYRDIVYPLDKAYRDKLTKAIIEKYEKEIDNYHEKDSYTNFE